MGFQNLTHDETVFNTAIELATEKIDIMISDVESTLRPRSSELVTSYLYELKEELTNNLKGINHTLG